MGLGSFLSPGGRAVYPKTMRAGAPLLVGLTLLLTGCGTAAGPQGPHAYTTVRTDESALHVVQASSHSASAPLFRAFVRRLTVWTRPDGRVVLTRHCREMPVDCRSRLRVFAAMMHDVAKRHQLDPFLLGALAFHESGLNPGAVGPLGTAGLIQLHPRGVGRGERFVHDEAFRNACLGRIDACQEPLLERGAAHIAASITTCGNLRKALGRFGTGRCTDRGRYIGRVLAERERLRSLADR